LAVQLRYFRRSLNLISLPVERPIVSGTPDGYAVRQLHPLPVEAVGSPPIARYV